MEILLLSLVIFVAAVLAMSFGTLFGNRIIKGSCGGLNDVPGAKCAACTRRCDTKRVADTVSSRRPTPEPHEKGD